MRREVKRVLAGLLAAMFVLATVGFASLAADTSSEAQPVDNNKTKNTTDKFISPIADILDAIPDAAAIAVNTQEWYGKALANTDTEADILTEAVDGSAIAGKMYSNTIVVVQEKGDMWSKVSSGDVNGYVKNESLVFGQDAVERAKAVCPSIATPISQGVDIHVIPDSNGGVKGVAEIATSYPVIEDMGKWVKVQDTDSSQAYIEKSTVSISRNTQDAKSMEQLAAEEAARIAAEQEAARIAEEARIQEEAANAVETISPAMSASVDEQTLLAAIIHCEAGGEPYEGQVAVGAVILNRVRSGVFPNSISEVIYQSGQFGPAITGKLDRVLASGNIYASCYEAAADALAGANPIGDALYFGCGDYGQLIGGHWFH